MDFEDGTYYPWEGQHNDGGFAISQDSDPSIGKFGKFTIGEGDDLWLSPNSGLRTARSEIQLFDTCEIDSTMYYSWDFMIPEEYVESDDWQVIGQFHDQPDASVGETWATYPAHSPPIAIRYNDSRAIIAVYSWGNGRVMDIASARLSKGAWHRLALKVTWSMTSGGLLQAWLDGAPIVAPNGAVIYEGRNSFNSACNYLKIGLYRSNTIATMGVVYFDNVTSSFEEIALTRR